MSEFRKQFFEKRRSDAFSAVVFEHCDCDRRRIFVHVTVIAYYACAQAAPTTLPLNSAAKAVSCGNCPKFS